MASIDLDRTAHEHAAALRAGEYTSVQLAEATLARVHAQEGALHAYVTITDDLALEQARAADARIGSGDAGPLTGVPVAVKDLLSTKGVRTTASSRMLENFTPVIDSTVVQRLNASGAVTVGKANLDEFAMGSSTEHSYFGPTHNPWD
ncbi:MAG: Asp-tRNA(Asn)/Glu-tRNA(Gln) amidotransferase subunit GatA, partial [Dehalococcoidia bacterium]|nr:Asp-tRNA(Asn)/Glu-tRNA(Gln) amidotransferase subunit GatA [Dehalococcoidia bacterium]